MLPTFVIRTVTDHSSPWWWRQLVPLLSRSVSAELADANTPEDSHFESSAPSPQMVPHQMTISRCLLVQPTKTFRTQRKSFINELQLQKFTTSKMSDVVDGWHPCFGGHAKFSSETTNTHKQHGQSDNRHKLDCDGCFWLLFVKGRFEDGECRPAVIRVSHYMRDCSHILSFLTVDWKKGRPLWWRWWTDSWQVWDAVTALTSSSAALRNLRGVHRLLYDFAEDLTPVSVKRTESLK